MEWSWFRPVKCVRWTSGNSNLALIRDIQQVAAECKILQAGCAVRIFFVVIKWSHFK